FAQSDVISVCFLSQLNGSNATASGPSVALTRQAIELGIDATTLGELWRNKQPVAINKPDASGQLHTTTYSLSPDGESIIVRTDPEEPPAPKLDPIPTTSSTTTPSPQTDWEYLPNSIGNRRTFTTTNLGSDWPSLGGSFPLLPGSRLYPSFDFSAGVTPQTQTKTEQDDQGNRVTTTIKTYGTPLFSTSSHSCELTPEMRNLLDRGGITDEDINTARARGEDLVRTRTTPDGRKITTTVRVNSTPVLAPLPTAPPQANVLYRSQPEAAAAAAPAPAESSDKSIDNFLSQVNLKPSDILEHNGEVVKTIVDKDGRVLSARFVLSTAKGDEQGQGQGPPTK
ncbi:hypothetical protein KR215_000506, partial [Drosophila sulfurigaster]